MTSPKTSLKTLAIAGLALLAAAPMADAEPFTIFLYETRADIALRTDPGAAGQAYWAEYADFAGKLQASGAIRGGAPLAMPETAVTLAGGERKEGVAQKGRLVLGGYFQVEAKDLAAAEAMAAESPAARRGGRAEVRGTYPAPTMMR